MTPKGKTAKISLALVNAEHPLHGVVTVAVAEKNITRALAAINAVAQFEVSKAIFDKYGTWGAGSPDLKDELAGQPGVVHFRHPRTHTWEKWESRGE